MAATGPDIVNEAMRADGMAYRLGAEANLHTADLPAGFDCSELVEYACARNGVFMPDGTVNQLPYCAQAGSIIPIGDAIATPGALLFVWVGPHGGGGNGNHVAISRGDGTTIEARSTRYGVGVFSATTGRAWTHGALIPEVDYAHVAALVAEPEETDDMGPITIHPGGDRSKPTEATTPESALAYAVDASAQAEAAALRIESKLDGALAYPVAFDITSVPTAVLLAELGRRMP